VRRIVTISFTPLDAGGGVPKFNRDLHAAFPDRECVHFSWWDFPWAMEMDGMPEWEKARTLNHYLVQTRKVTRDDVVIADGFWAEGLEHLPLAVSHSHGIWGHVTKDDVDKGVKPENPVHHAVQIEFRRRWISQRKHITAVSDFIAEQMRLQWGFEVERVINNGVDTDVFTPYGRLLSTWFNDPLIIHGVNDRGNLNKGWDHIEFLKKKIPSCHILSLDEAHSLVEQREGASRTKAEVLALADIVVHPSGFEGNSMFVAEALACGVPVVGYDVGFLWSVRDREIGYVIPRTNRSPEATATAVQHVLNDALPEMGERCRELAVRSLSIERFRGEWRRYVEGIIDAA